MRTIINDKNYADRSTERLLIRTPLPGDGKVVYESINSSINELKELCPLFGNLLTKRLFHLYTAILNEDTYISILEERSFILIGKEVLNQ